MTREEAIKWLICVKEEVDESEGTMIYISKKQADALGMAIEALSESNVHNLHSGDLISRADAREAGCGVVIDEFDVSTTLGYEVAEKALSALPSAEAVEAIHDKEWVGLRRDEYEDLLASAEAEWIPCSERLPSEDGRYLVTYPLLRWQNNWINLMHYGKPSMPNCEVKGKCFYVSDDEWGDVVYDNIIAWMPLPKPYREDGEA